MNDRSKTLVAINDVLSEVLFCLERLSISDDDIDAKKDLAITHSLSWDLMKTCRRKE